MSSFADYVGSDYLPGQVYSAGLSEYKLLPAAKTAYMARKRFKFQPDKTTPNYYEQFMALQNNPEALATASMDLPDAFTRFPGY